MGSHPHHTHKKLSLWRVFKNEADDGTLLKLFNKTLQPILCSYKLILLHIEIENYINGVEK